MIDSWDSQTLQDPPDYSGLQTWSSAILGTIAMETQKEELGSQNNKKKNV